jgi:DNA-binding MarR family transcriptional regulator
METAIADFRLRLCVSPQPVALALGRICRHPNTPELLEATLKTSEVLARYLSALAVSSFCARDDAAAPTPNELKEFRGNLSFGHFLSALKGIARSAATHPLKADLEPAFRVGSDGEKAFDSLVGLRNDLGHKLSAINYAKAEQILQQRQPVECLSQALNACQRLLDLPLFLLEEQRMVKKVLRGRRLLLMGDAEPTPDFIEMEGALGEDDKALYVGLRNGALRLPPFLLWDIVQARASYGLYLLHRAHPKKIEYLTVHDDEIERAKVADEFEVLLKGGHRPVEPVTLKDGGNLLLEWAAQKKVRIEVAQPKIGPIPWSELSDATLAWYDGMLKAEVKSDAKPKRPGSAMVKMLLDGRDILSADDLRQIVLLFGKEKAVRALVKRPLVDCRARKLDSEKRWEERKESTTNVFESLKVAIEFFTRHLAVEGATLDGFKATAGTADYIAMREALINLFIHQDYTHSGMAGQVEIRENQAVFFNPGRSLVPLEGILDGGKSTSRNPVVSRAMRLIGFAELAGSGLYVVRNEWRKTRGVAPKIESNAEANTFSLTFDWILSAEGFDEYWKEKLGVKLTSAQASILPALAGGPLTPDRIAAATGMNASDTDAAIKHLRVQTLIIEDAGKFSLRPDVLSLLPKGASPAS